MSEASVGGCMVRSDGREDLGMEMKTEKKPFVRQIAEKQTGKYDWMCQACRGEVLGLGQRGGGQEAGGGDLGAEGGWKDSGTQESLLLVKLG